MAINKSKNPTFIAWAILAVGALFYCYEYFLRIAPSVMTSELMRAYDLNGVEVGNLSAYYYQAYVPMQIIVGLLMDRYGPRYLLTVASLFCALGAFLFGSHWGLGWAEGGRFLIGFGSAFAFIGAMKLATIWLPPNRFALLSGIIMCLGMIGAMAGDVMLRKMVDALGWQDTIFVSALSGIFLAVVIWSIVRDVNPLQHYKQGPKMTFQKLVSSLMTALANPQLWLNAIVGFLLYLSLCAFAELWGIPYLEQAQSFSRTTAAYANAMIFLGWAVGSPAWGYFSDLIGLRKLPIIIASTGACIAICFLLYVPNLSTTTIFVTLFLFGFLSGVQILVFAICHELSGMRIVATAIAFTNMVVMVGGNIFQPIIGKLLDKGWTEGAIVDGARVYSSYAYKYALSVLPLSIFIAIIITMFIRETYCTSQHSDRF